MDGRRRAGPGARRQFGGRGPAAPGGRLLVASGVTVVALLALSDEGAPAYDHDHAAALAALGLHTAAPLP